MTHPVQGFIDVSYELTDRYAAVERTVNWLLTQGQGGVLAFQPCPCNAAFGTLPVPAPFNQANRALIENRGQLFGVNGTVVFQMDSAGRYTQIGTVNNSQGKPAKMKANGNGQILIASSDEGYVIPANGGMLIGLGPAGANFLGASDIDFQDGYGLAVNPNSNVFQTGGTDDVPVGDFTKWDASRISVLAGQADFLKAIISRREYVRLLGERRGQIFYNSGGVPPALPFTSFNDTFIEQGIAAVRSLVSSGDQELWISQNIDGIRACVIDGSNFDPQTVSTLAIGAQWKSYVRIDDCIAMTFLWRDHNIVQFHFPSAVVRSPKKGFPLGVIQYESKTWWLDLTMTRLMKKPCWIEREMTDSVGRVNGRAENNHAYAFGLNLVGSNGTDGNPGAIYQWSDQQAYDVGSDPKGNPVKLPHVPIRVWPHLNYERKECTINRIRLQMAQGVGLDGLGSNIPGFDPLVYLQVSKDGGASYGNQQAARVGRLGEDYTLTEFGRQGHARDFVLKLFGGDPVYYGVVAAFVDGMNI